MNLLVRPDFDLYANKYALKVPMETTSFPVPNSTTVCGWMDHARCPMSGRRLLSVAMDAMQLPVIVDGQYNSCEIPP